jgi:hypothetical protein
MAGMKRMSDISGPEIYTAVAAGLGLLLLFDHFHLISSGYLTGRLEARATYLFGAGMVILIWSLVTRKKEKKDDSDDPS